jgi:ketosteroid isomerase-like protein
MRRYFPPGRRSARNAREPASDTLVAATDDLTLAAFTVDRHLRQRIGEWMERSIEIEELVGAWFSAATKGDPSLVAAHVSLSDATRLIGSDPSEVFKGGAAVSAFLAGEVERSGGRATFTPTNTEAFRDGSVGWATTHVTIAMPDGRHVSPRWSAVFHLEDGIWKFVQTHASIAVPNDQIGWTYPDDAAE